MKKGKTSKISGFNSAKVIYGTVDFVELKSLYLNIQTWVEPIDEHDNWNRIVLNMGRAIKHTTLESIDENLFNNNFIVDLDLRSSGIIFGKKSFMNLEINFFLNQTGVDFKSLLIKDSLKNITSNIFDKNIYNNKYFNFYLTKKSKSFDMVL